MITVRKDLKLLPVEPSHQRELLELMLHIYPPVYGHLWYDGGKEYLSALYAPDRLRADLGRVGALFQFVYDGDLLVGILRVITNEGLTGHGDSRQTVKLQRLYLSREVWRRGIGQSLVTWVEDNCCPKPATLLWLDVMDTQQPAIKFYEKLGFGEVDKSRFEDELMRPAFRGMLRMAKVVG